MEKLNTMAVKIYLDNGLFGMWITYGAVLQAPMSLIIHTLSFDDRSADCPGVYSPVYHK